MKNNPQRLCVACRSLKDKKDLLRIVKCGEEFFVDNTGKKNGRGAYICNCDECKNLAKKNNMLSKSFKCKVSKEFYDEVINYGKN